MKTTLLSMLLALQVGAASFYASVDAVSGSGTFADPWHLGTALTNSAIAGGDTLYLKDGTYSGNFISTISASNGNITVRPLTSLGNVILTDGRFGTLQTTMTTNTSSIVVEGADYWPASLTMIIGGENLQINSKSSPTNLVAIRGWNGTAKTTHSIGDRAIIKGEILNHTGSNVIFRELIFTSVQATNRVISPGGTNNWYVSPGMNIDVGTGNSVLGCIFYNVGQPALGYWDQGVASVDGCLFWGNGYYDWNGALWTRGSGIYAQNGSGGMTTIRNLISFRNFTAGAKVYGETGPVKDFTFAECIAFDNSLASLEASSGSSFTSNTVFANNWMMGSPSVSYASATNVNQYFYSNTVVSGYLSMKNNKDSSYTNNLFLLPKNVGSGSAKTYYQSTTMASNEINNVWDWNTYYIGDGSSRFNWDYDVVGLASVNSAGGGILAYDNDVGKSWKEYSRWDSNSVIYTNWSTSLLDVQLRKLSWNTNRMHVFVLNTDTNRTSTTVTIPGVSEGFYTLRDAQNYFSPTRGAFAGGVITLSLASTSVTAIAGTLTHYTNVHTNFRNPGLFNAFVIDVEPGSGSVSISSGRYRKSVSR